MQQSPPNLLKYQLKGAAFSYTIDVADLQHWRDYAPPVALVLWDTKKRCGYWSMIADVLSRLEQDVPGWESQKSVKVRVLNTNPTDDDGLKQLRAAVAFAMWPMFREGKTGYEAELCLSRRFRRARSALRKISKNRALFPSDEAVFKLLYLALRNISKKWTMPIANWGGAMNQFAILFEGRLPSDGLETLPFTQPI